VLRLVYAHFWVFKPYCIILFDSKPGFGGFWSFLGDLEPFLRPYLGRKLGGCYQLQIYINQRLLEALREVNRGKKLWNCEAKYSFMKGSH
jgi:hypothetical protein